MAKTKPTDGLDADQLLLERWKEHLERLAERLQKVHIERLMFKALIKAIEDRAVGTPTTWPKHYARLYLAGQTMALRSLSKPAPGSITLSSLIREMKLQEATDPVVAEQHVQALMRNVAKVNRWADDRIAHILIDGNDVDFTFQELDDLIDYVTELYNTYRILLINNDIAFEVDPLPYWQSTFDRVLMPSPFASAEE
jgi:hypothetical protein